MALLTKSKFISGLRCSKLLWMYCNDPKSIPAPTESTQYFLSQGTDIGVIAQQLFPNGRKITTSNFSQNLNDTKTFLALRIPLFEPSMRAGDLYARADIIEPLEDGSWNLYEVKSSANVREEQVRDVAFQRMVFTRAGLTIHKVFVIVVNNDYLFNGELDIKQFFRIEDVTERANSYTDMLNEESAKMLDIIKLPECPDIKIHPQCKGSRYCEMLPICFADLPTNNVTTLVADNEGNGMKLLMEGITDIKDIPLDYELNAKQEIQRQCILDNKAHINKDRIQGFLDSLEYPLYFMDFETIQRGLPFFANSKPYQQIPFQYSVHVIEKPGDTPKHYEYLHNNEFDPRPEFLNHLKKDIGTCGSILVYYEEFEKSRLKEAAEQFPEHSEWISDALNRIVDLFPVFKSLDYYNPEQCGSLSLKKVLPALTGKSYDHLEIRSGELAPANFLHCYHDELVTDEERIHIRTELLKYCGLDTEGMIFIIDELRRLIN